MREFKIGDKFELVSDCYIRKGFLVGSTLTLIKIEMDDCHLFECENKRTIYLYSDGVALLEFDNDSNSYKNSNRHKLSQAVKKSNFSSRDLSMAIRNNDSHFYNLTCKSRFTKRGDISEVVLNSALGSLKRAEQVLIDTSDKDDKDCALPIPVDQSPKYEDYSQSNKEQFIEAKCSIEKKTFRSIVFIFILLALLIVTAFVKNII